MVGAGVGSYPHVALGVADVFSMDSEKPVDRLLPRHSLGEQRPQIGWDVQPANRLRRRPETVGTGFIVDLSLDGALIEVADTHQHEIDDVVVVRFGEKYRQWNAAFDAGMAAALGKSLIVVSLPEHQHALKEVHAAALAVTEEPGKVAEMLRYVLTGQLPGQ